MFFFSSKSFNNISLINLYHLCCISNACQDSAQWISDHDPPAHTATDPRKIFPKLGSLFGNHSSELTPVVEEFNRLSVTEISEAFKLYLGKRITPSVRRLYVSIGHREKESNSGGNWFVANPRNHYPIMAAAPCQPRSLYIVQLSLLFT